jgi:hypothetical protein
MAQEQASVTIQLNDEISEPLARIQAQFEQMSATMKEISGENPFAPTTEQIKKVGEAVKTVEQSSTRYVGEMSGLLKEFTKDLGRSGREVEAFGKHLAEVGRHVARFVGGMRGLRVANAVADVTGLATAAIVASRTVATAYQNTLTLQRQLSIGGNTELEALRKLDEQLGRTEGQSIRTIGKLVDQMRDLIRKGPGAQIVQELEAAHGLKARPFIQEMIESANKTKDAWQLTIEFLKKGSEQGEDFLRLESTRTGESVRFLEKFPKLFEEIIDKLASPEQKKAMEDRLAAQKKVNESYDEYRKAVEEFAPIWLKAQADLYSGLAKILTLMTKLSQMKLPEIPESWITLAKIGAAMAGGAGGGRTRQPQQQQQGGGAAPFNERFGDWGGKAKPMGYSEAGEGTTSMPILFSDLDKKQDEGNRYLREMRDVLEWIKNQQQARQIPGGRPGLQYASYSPGGGLFPMGGAGAPMGGLPSLPGAGPRRGGGPQDGGPQDGGPQGLRIPTSPQEAPETLQAAREGGFMATPAGPLEVGKKGTVDPGALNAHLQALATQYGLAGQMPADAARYGFKTGSAAEWGAFMQKLAGAESSYRASLANVSAQERRANPAGSHGLFQLSPSDAIVYGIQKTPFTMAQLRDPKENARIAVQIMTKLVRQGGLTGRQGAQKYWAHGGTFRRISPGDVRPIAADGGVPQFTRPGQSMLEALREREGAPASAGDGTTATPGPGFAGLREGSTKGLNPELVARYNALWAAAPPEARKGAGVISGVRSRELQAQLYQKYRHGGNIAAPPGHSQHERGGALDIKDPTGWFHRHAAEYGIHFPVLKRIGRDYPHAELDPRYRGKPFAVADRAAQDKPIERVTKAKAEKKTAQVDVDFKKQADKSKTKDRSEANLKKVNLGQTPQMNVSTKSSDNYAEE